MFRRGVCRFIVSAVPLALMNSRESHSSSTTTTADAISGSEKHHSKGRQGILFLGTGSSSSVPQAFELMQPDKVSSERRRVALLATVGDPRFNKNYRCNPSLLLSFDDKNIVIDAGKTFRESIIRWFPEHHVRTVDSIVLTHGHADAMFGLDDIRTLQGPSSPAMEVFLSSECFKVVARTFPYLLPQPPGDGAVRKVSSVNFNIIEEYSPFQAAGLTLVPVPVMHGEDLKCMGFIFGRHERVCYLSDISRMLPDTLAEITKAPVDVLIVDALLVSSSHPFHYSLKEAVELCKVIRPRKARFVGMTSEFDYDTVSKTLQEISAVENIDMQLAYDGMFLGIDI